MCRIQYLFSAMSSATLGAGAVTILEDGSLSLVGGDPVGAHPDKIVGLLVNN